MTDIQILSPHIADLIAAGEVVERPASVAKELMENAIDAKATKIVVEIEHGGMTYLRVTDNGGGIPADQLATAFLRHATSKLRCERDLEAIGTLGFRGEALAAISAVSRISVLTRQPSAPLGASLTLEAGRPEAVEEAGCPIGTTMVVRDLFHNTPARLKFVKKDSSEGAAVFSAVQRVALSHPEVAITFIRDGKQELATAGDGKLKSALYAILGRNTALGYIPLRSTTEVGEVAGFISLPTCCRGSRANQHFFVNGRYVKSGTLMAAVEEGYRNQKMVGRFPGCTLHLTVSPASVDVNVHPAKTEIKFHNERELFRLVHHAVADALAGDNSHTPIAAVPMPAPVHEERTIQPAPRAERPAPARPIGQSLPLHDFFTKEAANPPAIRKIWGDDTPAVTSTPAVKPAPAEAVAQVAPAPPTQRVEVIPIPEEIVGTPVVEVAEPPIELPLPTVPWRVAGEVLHTYIIVEQGEKILLIDKHATHERLNFDRMRAEGYEPMMQALILPLNLRLPMEEQAVLLENVDLLLEFGFEITDFGGSIAVRQLPFDVDEGGAEGVLSSLANTLLTTGRLDPAGARDEILHTMACKAAIKGGWTTSELELQYVAEQVMSGAVKFCPHGRPVAVELTKYQIEKMFGRA